MLQSIKYSILSLLFFNCKVVKCQKFYSEVAFHLIPSQIDGDNASGYYKFGANIGITTGLQIKTMNYTMGVAFSERGSRRNPINSTPMHLVYRTVDLILGGEYKYKKNIHFLTNVTLAKNIFTKDKEGFIKNLNPTAFFVIMGAGTKVKLLKKLYAVGLYEYSLTGINKNGNLFRGNSFFNCIHLGLSIQL